MFQRSILHLDLDSFFVSVERLRNSRLNGIPLIIGGYSDRAVVASCSYEARAYGVRSAMPVKMALKLCPDATVLKGDMEAYQQHSKVVTEIIREQAPVFEKSSIDEFFLDLSGMDKYVGCWHWAQELRQRIIRESGLPISSGLSVNKLISKIGTGEAKPLGEKLIQPGLEKAFIAPMSVRKIPSIGKVTFKKLSLMGIHDVKTLSEIPKLLLQREFGKNGLELWKKANAIDYSPVVPYRERKSISTEHTFEHDTIDVELLKNYITKMVVKLAYELRSKKKLTANIAIKLRYADFNTYSKQQQIPYTASDQTLIEFAHRLFEKLYQKRQLIRLIGVRFGKLVHGQQQMELFNDSHKEQELLRVMDDIRKKFGIKAIKRAIY